MRPRANIEQCRSLRCAATVPERLLWAALRNGFLGAKFRRQHPLGPYIADFCSVRARIVVEVDAASHQSEHANAHDFRRDAWIRARGFEIVRFSALEVSNGTGGVIARIRNALPQPVP
jgi:very-short-patch-repair endonuclease